MQTRGIGVLALFMSSAMCLAVAAGTADAATNGRVQAFHGLTPKRIVDTRPGCSECDPNGTYGGGPVHAGDHLDFFPLGDGGIPKTGVGSIVVNITATNTTAPSFVTIYNKADPQPTASNLNFVAGQTVANMAIVSMEHGSSVRLYNNGGDADLIVDVLGWFPKGNAYAGLTPARVLDTRAGFPTVDLLATGTGPIGPGATVPLQVGGRGGVPANAAAVALNVTVAGSTAAGYLTVFPAGAPQPTASNLNFIPGQVVPNMVIVPLGPGGLVSLYNNSGNTEVAVDVLGYFAPGALYTGLTPARLLDTRAGFPTIDGQAAGSGAVGPGGSIDVTIAGRGGVPASGAGAVALNVTATNPTATTYITAWPTGAARPTASNINLLAGQSVPNMVMAKLGADGKISLFNNGGNTDLIIDVLGWFPADFIAPSTDLVSVASISPPANANSNQASVSGDGRYVAFASGASNLVSGDNADTDVFVRDRMTGITTLVSQSTGGAKGNGMSSAPSISADGRYIAFQSAANNLVAGDNNGKADIFLRDTVAGTTVLISKNGATLANGDSRQPDLSADGKWVVFTTAASNLPNDPAAGKEDVYIREVATDAIAPISVTGNNAPGNGDSLSPSISADGTRVAFTSVGTNIVSGDVNGKADVFVRDRVAGTTIRASVSANGTPSNGDSDSPSISGDGMLVAFASTATNLSPQFDFHPGYDVYLRSLGDQDTLLISVGVELAPANGDSDTPVMSTNGKWLAFGTTASNITDGDTNAVRDIVVFSIEQGGFPTIVSTATGGAQANAPAYDPAISGDGRYVAFDTQATNLGPDANLTFDVFIHDLGLD
jgi:Tol biopolymer transport system component